VVVLQLYGEGTIVPMVNMPAMHLLFMPLFIRNRDGEIEGRLVRDWDHSEDGRTWTYHLRTDLRWHDGVPVTAHDVKFTLDLYTHPDVLYIRGRTATVINDSTFAITYEGGVGQDPLDTWLVYLPKHLLQDLDPSTAMEWDFWTEPVGNGPYRWAGYVPETMIDLEANPDFYLGPPEIERVILKLRGGDAVLDLKAGVVDITGFGTLGRSSGPALIEDSRLALYWGLRADQATIYLNHSDPALADVRVRRAITLAIDRRTQRLTQFVPEEAPFFDLPITEGQLARGEYPEPLPHDPGRARELLAEAGWVDIDGDGIRERAGARLEIDFIGRSGGMEFIQDQLRRVGIALEIQSLQGGVAGERFRDGDYQAYGIEGSRAGPRFLTRLLGEALEGASHIGYRAPDLARIGHALQTAMIPEVQDSLHREMWAILHEDVPVLFLGAQVFFSAAHTRVQGMKSPTRVWAVSYMDELWVEEEGTSFPGTDSTGGGE
jgi:peptide/nickel transport system substrate-binding protein